MSGLHRGHSLLVASFCSAPLACVPHYDTRPLIPTEAEVRVASSLAYPLRQPPDRINLINDEWRKVDARCAKVRAAMLAEADGISARNAAVGAAFAAATAALAASSGIYTAARADSADPAVSATLAFGAGATSVPTFFFFGTDEREKSVRARLATIDERRKRVADAWASFKAKDREFTSVSRDLGDVRAALARVEAKDGGCDHDSADDRVRCEAAAAALEREQARRREVLAAWHHAGDALDDAIGALGEPCK